MCYFSVYYLLFLILYTGAVAGDEETYDVFADLFDPIIEGRHNGYTKTQKHRTDLNYPKIIGGEFDPKYVLSCRVSQLEVTFTSVRSWPANETNIAYSYCCLCLCVTSHSAVCESGGLAVMQYLKAVVVLSRVKTAVVML